MPERPGVVALVETLEVRKQARRGFGVALLVTAAVFGFFVVLPGATTQAAPFYVLLAFVFVVSLGLLATAALIAVAAVRAAWRPPEVEL